MVTKIKSSHVLAITSLVAVIGLFGIKITPSIKHPTCQDLNEIWQELHQTQHYQGVIFIDPPKGASSKSVFKLMRQRRDAILAKGDQYQPAKFDCPSHSATVAKAWYWADQFSAMNKDIAALDKARRDQKFNFIYVFDRNNSFLAVALAATWRNENGIAFYPQFFHELAQLNPDDRPFLLMSVLIHEWVHLKHKDSLHIPCRRGPRKGYIACDKHFQENALAARDGKVSAWSVHLDFAKWYINNARTHGLPIEYAQRMSCYWAKTRINDITEAQLNKACNV